MKNKNLSDEVDLIDVIQVIYVKKFQVIFFVILSIVTMLIVQSNKPPSKIIAITEIKPISVYDEEKYKIYNSFLKTIQPYYIQESVRKFNSGTGDKQFKNYNIINTKIVSLSISDIDKKFLLDLFIDRLNERTYMIESIKKFGLIKKENYENKLDYEKSVLELSSSIVINKNEKESFIEVETYDIENWEEFLKYIEKKANLEIQRKLSEMFANYVKYAQSIRNFEIEDILTQLSITQNVNEKIDLESKRSILSENKYIDRLQNIFENSPVAKSDNFYAAKIVYNSTNYEFKNDPGSMKTRLLVSGICGGVFGIFFVLIANTIQNKK